MTIALTRVDAVVRSIADTTWVFSKLFGAVAKSLAGADAAARSFWRSSGKAAVVSFFVPQAPANTASERAATFTCFRMCTTSEMAPDCMVYACAKCIGCATSPALQQREKRHELSACGDNRCPRSGTATIGARTRRGTMLEFVL